MQKSQRLLAFCCVRQVHDLIVKAWEVAGDVCPSRIRNHALRAAVHPDGNKVRVLTHIKPLRSAGRHRDHIVPLAQHRIQVIADVQRKQSASGGKKTYHISAKSMLVHKPCAQLGFLRVFAADADYVKAGAAVFAHQPINRLTAGLDHFVLAGARLGKSCFYRTSSKSWTRHNKPACKPVVWREKAGRSWVII